MGVPAMRAARVLLSIVATALVARVSGDVATYAECRNPYFYNDPPCKHNTSLWTSLSPHPANCAHCVANPNHGNDGSGAHDSSSCPGGWSGVDCSACQTKDVCPDIFAPDGTKRVAKACTNDCLVPTDEELGLGSPFGDTWESGKVFSCRCGGDTKTDPYCQFQKDTTFLWHVTRDTEGRDAQQKHNVKMHVKEYAGIPNMGNDPVDADGTDQSKYKFAYAPVWDANFTGCAWRVSDCLDPLPADETCAIYECPSGNVVCPPTDVPQCPGRSEFGCGRVPNATNNYWQHPCNPLVTPQNTGITFWCSLNRTSTDAYGTNKTGRLCYWNQPGVIPSFAVTCDVGNCLYEDDQNSALRDICPSAFTPPEFWTGDLLTRIGMFLVAGLLVWAAGRYVRLERNSLYSLPAELEGLTTDDGTDTNGVSRDDPLREEASHDALQEEAPDFQNSVFSLERPVVSWENVFVYARAVSASTPGNNGARRILRGVAGHAGPGPGSRVGKQSLDLGNATRATGQLSGVFAILGPSGAGKSTLLDFLAGRTPGGQTGRGAVCVNGESVSPNTMRRISGYVPQTDVLPGTSTVWEHLLFNAMLRLPSSTKKEELTRRAHHWASALGLQKVLNSLIGDEFQRGLAGGEKRRVSIACALLTSPSVLFLDEPTTGLDSTNAKSVVEILAGLGERGVTVLLSIHQPRSDVFCLMDRVLLMGGNGNAVYCGPMRMLGQHFHEFFVESRPEGREFEKEKENNDGAGVLDFVLDHVLRFENAEADDATRVFKNSEVRANDRAFLTELRHSELKAPSLQNTQLAPFKTQLKLLCGRLLRKTSRHPFLLRVHFASSFATAVGVGLIFFDLSSDQAGIQNRLGALFFILLYLTLMSLSSLPVWREDKLLFRRERADGVYGVNAYFLSQLFFDILPMRVLPPFFFGLITYQMLGLNQGTEYSLVVFVTTLILTNICGTCLCLLVGGATESVASANAVASLFFEVSFLFGGFLLNKDQIPGGFIKRIANLSFINYGYEALVANEFGKNPTTFTLTSAWHSSKLPDEVPVPGEKVLTTFGFDSSRVFRDLAVVGAQALVFAGLSYLTLRNEENGVFRGLIGWVASKCRRTDTHREDQAEDDRDISQDEEHEAFAGTPLLRTERGFGDDDHDDENRTPLSPGDEEAAVPVRLGFDGFRVAHPLEDVDEMENVLGDSNAMTTTTTLSGRSSLVWEDVSCRLAKGGRSILRGVSGTAGAVSVDDPGTNHDPAGELPAGSRRSGAPGLFAVLGPSGAGKSTLLDILAGRPGVNRIVTGVVRVNGETVTPHEMRRVSGYVPQHDILPGTSTVWEHLLFHATLRVRGTESTDTTHTGNTARVSTGTDTPAVAARWVLKSLGIEKLKNTFIGDEWVRGLSGGERRRVSIACELLTSPAILFLDEPTTGLDSANASTVVDLLCELHRHGNVTVLLSIHQPRPEVFAKLGVVLVMSAIGKAVYCGPSVSLEQHFKTLPYVPPRNRGVSVADYVLDAVLRADDESVKKMVHDFETSPTAALDCVLRRRIVAASVPSGPRLDTVPGRFHGATRHKKQKQSKFPASYRTQANVLLTRASRQVKRHPFLFALHFVSTFIVALGVGFIFKNAKKDTGGIQNRMGSLFFILLHLTLMSLSSLPVWREERLLFLSERASGIYSTGVYFLQTLWFDVFILRVLPPVFFTLVSYPMIGLNGFELNSIGGNGDERDSDSYNDSSWTLTLTKLATFTLLLVLANIAASGLMMTIGLVTPSNATANACGLLVLLLNLLCGGFFLNEQHSTARAGENTPLSTKIAQTLSSWSFVNNAFEALLINEFLDAGIFQFTPKWHSSESGHTTESIAVDVSGQEVLQFFKFGDTRSDMLGDISTLAALAVGYVALAFVALKVTTRRLGVE